MDPNWNAQESTSYNLPQTMNQPSQAFDHPDMISSSAVQDFSGGPYFVDEQVEEPEEGNDAKRRRIARACDMCRKKKIKCDGKMPKCSHCINYKTECIFTHVEKKRNPPKGAKYIEGLENRLGRMESLLKLSGLLNEDDGDRTDLGTLEKRLAEQSSNRSADGSPQSRSQSVSQTQSLGKPRQTSRVENLPTPQSSAASPDPPKEQGEEVEALSEMMCSLVTNNYGETRYIGSSSGYSIFSPRGIQWVNEKTGDNSFQEMIASVALDDNKWAYWKPEIFNDMFVRRTFVPLPPRNEALLLLKDFFENFNVMFPLFHEPTFMQLVDKHYTRTLYEGSGWWASFNIALAIAHRVRIASNLNREDEDRKAYGFLKNAMGALTELTMRNTDLLSVQALLGMALFLLGTPNPQPSFFLIAAAIRLSYSIGLHKRGSSFKLKPEDIEQRKRVFWIAYMVDKDICLRSGRPPAQDDDDMNVELPSEDPIDNIGNIPLADGKGKTNIFRLMCTFAMIESKVYKQLYSTKASRKSEGEILNTIGELDKELEEWKEGIPLDFRPEHEIKISHPSFMFNIAVLHFAYYNCLTTIHRMSVHHGYWTSRLYNYAIQGLNARPLNHRVFSSALLSVQAARASINLLKYMPQGDYSSVWLILYFPVSALVTLFANILQNPQDARARTDIMLMNQVVSFLSSLSSTEEQGGIKRMLGVCSEFERIAKAVLEKVDKESHSRRKRRGNRVADEPSPSSQVFRAHLAPPTPVSNASPMGLPTPNMADNFSGQPLYPSANTFSSALLDGDMPISLDFTSPSSGYPSVPSPSHDLQSSLLNEAQSSFPSDGLSSLDFSSFQQPFVPQDLWQMPMTFEWNWADISNNAFNLPFDGMDTTQIQSPPLEEQQGQTPM